VDAGFEELAQGEFWHRHGGGSFRASGCASAGVCLATPDLANQERHPACELPAAIGCQRAGYGWE
jgi:hypothetical protein